MESKPVVTSLMDIKELMFPLRSSVRMSEFDNVERILWKREMRLKEERESLETKHAQAVTEHMETAHELRRCNLEMDHLKEQLTRLTEDNQLSLDREKRAQHINHRHLTQDFSLNKEMLAQLDKLRQAKITAEDQAQLWKTKYHKMEARFLLLEKDVDLLKQMVTHKKLNVNVGSPNPNLVQPLTQQDPGSGRPGRDIIDITDGDDETAGSGRPGSDIIDITDGDDERPVGVVTATLSSKLKRKRDSSSNIGECGGSDDANTLISKRKHLQELSRGPRLSPENHCFATPELGGNSNVQPAVPPTRHNPVFIRSCDQKPVVTSSDIDKEDIDYFMDNVFATHQRKKDNPKWESEVDMLLEFARDDEVCLNAVCSLYRKQFSKETSMKDPISSNSPAFNPFNALGGRALAKYLIDGDPQGKLKKNVSDVRVEYPKAISDSRIIAIQQSKQLFEIYKKKEDPFFLPHKPLN